MQIRPINELVKKQLAKWKLSRKFEKQIRSFEVDPSHTSLNTEKLEPKSVGLYSFRIDKKYRAMFRIRDGIAEIVHITKHYQQ